MTWFRDRDDSGRRLAARLKEKGYANPVVVGIPRGGVGVAAHVARELNGQLGVVVARKLRAPYQPELAIGAIASDGAEWLNEPLVRAIGVDRAYLDRERQEQAAEAARREEAFDGHRRPPIAGRTVIIVDDGIATGATAIAAVRSMKAQGAERVVLAVPVGPPHTMQMLRREADEAFALEEVEGFGAIGDFYADFSQVSDRQVQRILEDFDRERRHQGGRQVREARVPHRGGHLSLRCVTPAGDPPYPVVVFVHGLGSSKDSPRNVVVAERLVDAGLATVLFDLSDHGESTARGETIDDYADDLAAITRWVSKEESLDAQRMGIAGSSLGALAALRAVHARTVYPRTMVLRVPPVKLGAFDDLRVETLVIVGGADPLLRSIRTAATGRPDVTLSVVPGAGHLFEENGVLEEATRLTVDWFADKLISAHAGANRRGRSSA